MKLAQRVILGVLVLVAGIYVIRVIARKVYLDPRAALLKAIERDQKNLDGIGRARRAQVEIREKLQAIADQTMGATVEVVAVELRARLNRITEEIKLAGAAVSTGRPAAVAMPYEAKRELRGNPYKEEPDFGQLTGTVTGRGTLEQVMRLIHRVESEPWKKRIHSLAIDPDDTGEQFHVTLRLTTLFLPGYEPDQAAAPPPMIDGAALEQYIAFASYNPFRVPAPRPVPTQEPAEPAYDYGEWRITMVADGGRGREVWLLDQSEDPPRSKTLLVGERLREIELVAVSYDGVEFRLGDEHFRVSIGSTLAERTPLPRRVAGDG